MLAGLSVAAPTASSYTVPGWGRPAEITLPSNAVPGSESSGVGTFTINSVSCARPGDCTAVGGYDYHQAGWKPHTSGLEAPMAAEEIDRTWQPSEELSHPPTDGDPSYEPLGVSCLGVGDCVAVGYFFNVNDELEAAAYFESDGTWSIPTEIKLPANAIPYSGGGAELTSVSCVHSGECTAVGTYPGPPGPEGKHVMSRDTLMVATESGGTWSTAQELTVPVNDADGLAMESISCAAGGYCTAVGSGITAAGRNVALRFTETNGAWAPAQVLTGPSGSSGAQALSVSCAEVGDCSAVGDYSTPYAPGNLDFPFTVSETNGHWGHGQRAPLPLGATPSDRPEYGGLNSVSCTSPGNCTAAGSYQESGGNVEPMYAIELNGRWSGADGLGLPADGAPGTNEQRSRLFAISCAQAGACTTVGDYDDANQDAHFVGLTSVAADVRQLSVTSSSLTAHLDAEYSKKLSATGGTEHYTWSVVSGSLPAGLTLDPSTGAITGTPVHTGASHFKVGVSDPGLPPQDATASLSIKVGGLSDTHATLDNQRIGLGMPDGCVATGGSLVVALSSTKIAQSRAARLKFRKATLTFTFGKKHQSFTVGRLPDTLSFGLGKLKAGRYSLKIVFTYSRGRWSAAKTLRPHYTLCGPS